MPPGSPYGERTIWIQARLPPAREFPWRPFRLWFKTDEVPFHPNIDPRTGRLCIDETNHDPSMHTRVDSFMCSVQVLLGEPACETMEEAADEAAARAFIADPEEWKRKAAAAAGAATARLNTN
jgi:ubiquitin-protein ligase